MSVVNFLNLLVRNVYIYIYSLGMLYCTYWVLVLITDYDFMDSGDIGQRKGAPSQRLLANQKQIGTILIRQTHKWKFNYDNNINRIKEYDRIQLTITIKSALITGRFIKYNYHAIITLVHRSGKALDSGKIVFRP